MLYCDDFKLEVHDFFACTQLYVMQDHVLTMFTWELFSNGIKMTIIDRGLGSNLYQDGHPVQIKLGNEIGSGLSSMAVCFDFCSTYIVQLSNWMPYS